jgi:hypothetical protein
MTVVKFRNLLVGAGAFYLARWAAFPLAIAYGKLTNGIIYSGYFAGPVFTALVIYVPTALGAALAGASVAWLVESDRPQRWVIFPAALYLMLGLIGWHWWRPSVHRDPLGHLVGVLFPVVMCLVGGFVVARRRTAARTPSAGPAS